MMFMGIDRLVRSNPDTKNHAFLLEIFRIYHWGGHRNQGLFESPMRLEHGFCKSSDFAKPPGY